MIDDEEHYDCETCGDEGIVVTWVHREVWDGGHWYDVDPEVHELCPDCTEFYGPTPPWANWPECPECEHGFAIEDEAEFECIGCAHQWVPTDDERAQLATTAAAEREFIDRDNREHETWF